MKGLLAKVWRETWLAALATSLGMLLAVALLTRILPPMQSGIDEFSAHLPGLKDVLSGFLGVSVVGRITLGMLLGVVWIDPVVLAILWGFAVYFGSRFPAGEIDRGTIDILLSWPVSRSAIYLCETFYCLLWGAMIVGAGGLGFWFSSHWLSAQAQPLAANVGLVMANLYLVYLAVAGLTFLVSSLSDRRGPAMTSLFVVLAASYLLNLLVQIWPPLSFLEPFSLLHYYQPGSVLLSGILPTANVEVLSGFALASWLAGWRILSLRSLCTT